MAIMYKNKKKNKNKTWFCIIYFKSNDLPFPIGLDKKRIYHANGRHRFFFSYENK